MHNISFEKSILASKNHLYLAYWSPQYNFTVWTISQS